MASKDPKRIVIVGAGPAGVLAAHLFLNRGGFHVTLVERGINYADEDLVVKRSWMIGLAKQGLTAMKQVPGLYEAVIASGIPLKEVYAHVAKRSIKVASEETLKKGKDVDEVQDGYCVDRNWIVAAQVKHLMKEHGKNRNLVTKFRTPVLSVEAADKQLRVKTEGRYEERLSYDLLLGCDGIRSVVRDCFIRKRDFQCQVSGLGSWGRSLHVTRPEKLAAEAMHVAIGSGKGGFGWLALPQLDKDMKPSLWNLNMGFGQHAKDEVDPVLLGDDVDKITSVFEDYFGYIGLDCREAAEEYVKAEWNELGAVRCNYFHQTEERICLLGDAAHATTPQIGQGMNTALDDARVFHELMLFYNDDLDQVLPAFSRQRVKEGRALTDLSMYAFSSSGLMQAGFVLEETIWEIMPTWLKSSGHPNPGYRVGQGELLSVAYDECRKRIDKVRNYNEKLRQQAFEADVGLAPARAQRGISCLPFSCLGYEPARPPRTPMEKCVEENGLKLPGFLKLIKKLPVSLGKQVLVAQAPKEKLPDVRDILGKTPFKFSEIVPAGVWHANYTYQSGSDIATLITGSITDDVQKKILARAKDKDEEELLRKDIMKCACCKKMSKAEAKAGGWFKAGLKMESNMLIFKLASGGLLLYSPVKVDDEMKAFLDARGKVEYLVAPSNVHTTFMKSATEAYPDAKVIAPWGASVKLDAVGVKVDMEYTNYPETVVQALSTDFKVMVMKGDPNGELVLVHKATRTMVICDLLYSEHDTGLLSPEDAKDEDAWLGRIMEKQFFWPDFANGKLAVYRHQILDPDSAMPVVPAPKREDRWAFGRSVLDLLMISEVDRVASAHFSSTVSGEHGKKLLREAWGWIVEEALNARPPKGVYSPLNPKLKEEAEAAKMPDAKGMGA
mmetsp:Transcript_49668/g.118292  ORF Transcript_49668/g.118292 Transcript_49668/m.118292 type:complete len:896 (+) Transcript_49668:63-2750(+)